MRRATRSRPGRRRGFILLFGTRSIVSNDGEPPIETRCPSCERQVGLIAKGYRDWFTLFFIPVFPISGRRRFCECPACGAQFPGEPDDLRRELVGAEQRQAQEAIALYNGLRASPANAIALNQLMSVYASMKEFDQAVSAANEFPHALNSSEQCMTTLGRVLLAQNRHPEALQWFAAAVARNPMLGEAQYYKALTHLLSTPPDAEAAVAAARAARSAGYPNADALLRDAEAKRRGG